MGPGEGGVSLNFGPRWLGVSSSLPTSKMEISINKEWPSNEYLVTLYSRSNAIVATMALVANDASGSGVRTTTARTTALLAKPVSGYAESPTGPTCTHDQDWTIKSGPWVPKIQKFRTFGVNVLEDLRVEKRITLLVGLRRVRLRPARNQP